MLTSSDIKSLLFKKSTRHPLDFKSEVENACKKIQEKTPRKIIVCLSGGLDSEVIAKSLIKLNIPFECLVVEFDNGLNNHDIQYAKEFCNENKLTLHVLQMNIMETIKKWRENPYHFDSKVPCLLVYRFMQMHLMTHICENMNGFAIIGSGEQRYNNKFDIEYNTAQFSPLIFRNNKFKDCAEPYFFYSTPELIWSYANEAKNFIGDVGPLGHNIKTLVYEKFWPDLKVRPKYHGYEQIQNERNFTENLLSFHYYEYNKTFFINIQEILTLTEYEENV